MFFKFIQFCSGLIHLRSFPLFCVYLVIVMFSKRIIKRFKPLDLRQLMIWYNTGCSLASVLVTGLFVRGYLAHEYQSIFDKTAVPSFEAAFLTYAASKWVELLDTVFMILRHRQRQISVLHVYHHASILLLGDLTYSRFPWTGVAPFLALNSFVHIWLYMYYALSAAYPDNPPQWKKQITQLQIIQFFFAVIFSAYGYLYHGFCIYGPFYGLTMIFLFSNFYAKSYTKKANFKK